MSTYSQIFTRNKFEIDQLADKSKGWFQQQVLGIKSQGRVQPYYLMRGKASLPDQSQITPGELYMFYYDAKHKDTLQVWDKFPLVFPFRKLPDGFIGLNMHYLPYHLRARLLDRLMDFKTGKGMTDTTKLKFAWSTIQAASTMKLAQPCVHRYLVEHIRSPLRRVHSEDWATAMMLPVEQFTGPNKRQVWKG